MLCLLLGICVFSSYGFGETDAGSTSFDMIRYPTIRLLPDIGIDYVLNGVTTGALTYDENLEMDQDYINTELYKMVSPGYGAIVSAGLEFEAFRLWHGKGMLGGEAYIEGGFLNDGDTSQYLAGIGIGGTFFWIGKLLIGFGYSGFIEPIDIPTNSIGGSIVYEKKKAGSIYLGINVGLETPIVIIPNVSAFIYYRYFTMPITRPISDTDIYDYGYWLARNSICIGLSYQIGPGTAVD